LIIANHQSKGDYINKEFKNLVPNLPLLDDLSIRSVPKASEVMPAAPKTYSYTGDFLSYERCPRQYLIFRKFEFVPSRSQTMVFGSLVHRTLEDIHQYLIDQRLGQ